MEVEREMLTINEACGVVGVSRRTIYHWVANGKVEFARTPSGSLRIRRESLLTREPKRAPVGDVDDIMRQTLATRKLTIIAYAEMAKYADAATIGFKPRDPNAPDITMELIKLAAKKDPERTKTLLQYVSDNDVNVVRLTRQLIGAL